MVEEGQLAAEATAGMRTASRSKRSLYSQALNEAERVMLSEARQVEGLDEEIALLRVRLATLVAEHPENTELLLKGMGMLLRAVAAKYRLSRESKEDLATTIDNVLKRIGGALWPETFPPGE